MQTKKTPGLILRIGSILIFLSGILSLAISIPVGAFYNEIDPNGVFGHIGMINGIAAMLIGAFLLWLSFKKFSTPLQDLVFGVSVMVLGHIGAIAGALLVGTAGLLFCYVSGVWFIAIGIKGLV